MSVAALSGNPLYPRSYKFTLGFHSSGCLSHAYLYSLRTPETLLLLLPSHALLDRHDKLALSDFAR